MQLIYSCQAIGCLSLLISYKTKLHTGTMHVVQKMIIGFSLQKQNE